MILTAAAACHDPNPVGSPDAGIPDATPDAGPPRTVRIVPVGDGHVVSTPAGIDCPGTCEAQFSEGTDVVLAPAAVAGGKFVGWDGPCRGQVTCTLHVAGDTVV